MTEILLHPAGDPAGALASTSVSVNTGTNQAGAPTSPPLATPTTQTPAPGVAEFEKAQVAEVITKISGSAPVDAFGESISLDDRIRVVGEFQVVKVEHGIDSKGNVIRTQVVKPCGDLVLVPWNPSDPNDNGIVRARP